METRKRYYELETILKGVANHRRIEALKLLQRQSGLSTDELVEQLDVNYQTGAAHVRRLVRAGLVSAHRKGQVVQHELTPLGSKIIAFLIKL